MQIEMIECVVQLFYAEAAQSDLTAILRTGPSALTPGEIVLLRLIHDTSDNPFDAAGCCISEARVIEAVETTREQEFERLVAKYGAKKVERAFPRGLHLPMSLKALELPEGCLAKTDVPTAPPLSPAARKQILKDQLKALGVDLPATPLTEVQLQEMLEEAQAKADDQTESQEAA